MTRVEHLLTILAEEGCEVAQRCTKALRFGLAEVQPEQAKNNGQRIVDEYADLVAVMDMLCDEGFIEREDLRARIATKKTKVDGFYRYSAHCGTVGEQLQTPGEGAGEKEEGR